ncbi:MAG TPA: hypothetical protein VK636_15670 [Gemmatimonadaceae bacterium]|nr:hypothetical protein [Gemmatimonadaceae bacterium]
MTIGRNADGRLEVVAVEGADSNTFGDVFHTRQSQPNGGPWEEWHIFNRMGARGRPSVARNSDGRLELFVAKDVPPDQPQVAQLWQLPGNHDWNGWAALPMQVKFGHDEGPVAATNSDGRLELFSTVEGLVAHNWQTRDPANPWSGWFGMGLEDESSELAVTADGDRRIHLFAKSLGRAAFFHNTLEEAGWAGWELMLSPDDVGRSLPMAAGRNADGRVELFGVGGTGQLWHKWQMRPNSVQFSNWASLGGVSTSPPAVAQNADGRLEVFARGTDGALYHIWQKVPDGEWSGWERLGGLNAVNNFGPGFSDF